ncbi:MAG TPA: RIP metalloprotease RseP [Gemmatimonadales bacterium]
MNDALLTVLSLIIVLGVLVFVHELGHFLAAKWAGIRVFRFSVGMGAPIKRLTWTRGGTEYTISWLPLGGYVKMASQEEMAGDVLEGAAPGGEVPHEQTFEAKPVWKRMVVILAGVTFNVLFAWFLFSAMLYKNGRPVNPTTTVGALVDTLVTAELAPLAGLRAGDRITSVGGRAVTSWEEVTEQLQQSAGDSIVLEFANRAPLVLPIHHDAVAERIKAGLAILPELPPIVGRVLTDRPAHAAGLRVGDTILAIDGQPIGQWWDMIRTVEARAGSPMVLSIGRPGERLDISVTPRAEEIRLPGGETRMIGRIGVYPKGTDARYEPLGIGEAIVAGGVMTAGMSTFVVRSVRGMLTGRISAREVGGPIAIGQSAAESARAGFDSFLMFMALISVNLAVINMLPIPVLDGGQFLFLLGEAVLRRPLPLRLRQRLTAVGLLLLGLLMVLAFSNDIRRLFGF